MKYCLHVLALLYTLTAFPQQNFSEKEILQKIDSIHANPFSEDVKEITAQTLFWIQKESELEVLDIELFVNALKSSDRELGPYLIRSYFFGKVEHILKNQVADDDVDAKAAGLESLIEVYEQYLVQNPEAANPEANKLASMKGAAIKEYITSFNNRDGLSYETAVVPRSIIAEYEWMQEKYPTAKILEKELLKHERRTYDVFKLEKEDAEEITLYFDTSVIL